MVKLRGENRLQIKSTGHMYPYYKKMYGKPVDKTTFNKVMNSVFFEIRDYILTGDDYFLPYEMGVIGVRWDKPTIKIKEHSGKKVIRGLSINWGATLKWYKENINELKNASVSELRTYIKNLDSKDKMIIKHFNEHTQGKSAKIKYFKEYPGAVSKYRSKRYKVFRPGRLFKVALANAVNKNPDIPFAIKDKCIY